MNILIALLLSISMNLDNVIFGISYGKMKLKLPLINIVIIAIVTTLVTVTFMCIGDALTSIISIDVANIVGGIIPIVLGIYTFVRGLLENNIEKRETKVSISRTIILAIGLSINNIPLAISGGISNADVILVSLFSFMMSIIFIALGNNIGMKIRGKIVSMFASLLFIIIGILEIFVT